MQNRYQLLFARLAANKEGAFIPFVVLGDPNPARSLAIAKTLVDAGADALELGLPFSDPVADGPTIQTANNRALAAGARQQHAWEITSQLRADYPKLPMGMLVYANLVEVRGPSAFYRAACQGGVDSVLIADVPSVEIDAYVTPARAEGIDLVMIATPDASDNQLETIARCSRGYTYVVTRRGVTGADDSTQLHHHELVQRIAAHGAPPVVFGFGISTPQHVRQALDAGAAGVISGSAVVDRIAQRLDDDDALHRELAVFVAEMKQSCFTAGPGEHEH